MESRKGLEMTVTTIIMIVLSIAVLTILVVFLNSQTGFFSKWLKSQTSESTVDPFISNCNSLLNSESYYSYCCERKEVKFVSEDKIEAEKLTCGQALEYPWAKDRLQYSDCESITCSE
jgi:hypothetical protein